MLTDEELQAIAARHKDWRKSTGSGKQWHAARMAQQDVPALLRHIKDLTDERDAAVLARTEQDA